MIRPLALAALVLIAFLGTGTVPVFAQDPAAVAEAVGRKVDDLTATLRRMEVTLTDDRVAVEKKAEVVRLATALIAQLQRENAELRAKATGGEAEQLLAALAAKLDDRNRIVEMFRQALALAAADNRKSAELLRAAAARIRELETQLTAQPAAPASVTATAAATAMEVLYINDAPFQVQVSWVPANGAQAETSLCVVRPGTTMTFWRPGGEGVFRFTPIGARPAQKYGAVQRNGEGIWRVRLGEAHFISG